MELNKIYNIDCLEFMKGMESKSVDLILTSPPYNLGNKHHTGNNYFDPYSDDLPEDEYQKWQIEILNQFCRILKDNGSVIYNHKNRVRGGKTITPYEWILKSDLIVKQEIIWVNGGQNFDKCRFYPMSEKIFWLSKTVETSFFNNINHSEIFSSKEWSAVGTDFEHPRAFPLKMVQDVLCCFKADVIFDPFLGSGTTAIACLNTNRQYIGCEIDKDYFEIATKRIENAKKINKSKLF